MAAGITGQRDPDSPYGHTALAVLYLDSLDGAAALSQMCFLLVTAQLKQFRAVATRYDKRERIYQGTIDVASISIWLRDPVP
jgi:transposase